MDLLLLIVLILILMGGIPAYRSGTLVLGNLLSIVLIIVVVLLLVGMLVPYPHRVFW